MKKQGTLFLLLFFFLLPLFSSAQGLAFPHKFFGTVRYSNGDDIASGKIVSAHIGNGVVATSTVSGDRYGYNPSLLLITDDNGNRSGAEVRFSVDGVFGTESAIFKNGASTELHLVIPLVTPGTGNGSGSSGTSGGGGSQSGGSTNGSSGSNTKVLFSPQSVTLNKTSTATLEVVVQNVSNLRGIAFDLLYDHTLVEFQGATSGTFLASGCQAPVLASVNPPGTLIVGVSRLGSSCGGVSGSGTVATLTFKALEVGMNTFSYKNNKLCYVGSSSCDGEADWVPATLIVSGGSNASGETGAETLTTEYDSTKIENKDEALNDPSVLSSEEDASIVNSDPRSTTNGPPSGSAQLLSGTGDEGVPGQPGNMALTPSMGDAEKSGESVNDGARGTSFEFAQANISGISMKNIIAIIILSLALLSLVYLLYTRTSRRGE